MPILSLYTCNDALKRLNDYLDRELTPRETKSLERHLKMCLECSKKFAFEAEVIKQVRSKLKKVELPEGLMAKLSQSLTEESMKITPT